MMSDSLTLAFLGGGLVNGTGLGMPTEVLGAMAAHTPVSDAAALSLACKPP